jgi:hypothetical protein
MDRERIQHRRGSIPRFVLATVAQGDFTRTREYSLIDSIYLPESASKGTHRPWPGRSSLEAIHGRDFLPESAFQEALFSLRYTMNQYH